MSGILFAVGALTTVVGVAMVGFGIPVNEFSFGNTLIQSGVTAIVGGLIVIALGVVVAQLQRLGEALSAKSPIRSTRPMDMFDAARAARAPFPPRTKAEAPASEMLPQEPHTDRADYVHGDRAEEGGRSLFAPSLRNPEEAPVTLEEDVSLSPRHEEPAPQVAARGLEEPALKDHQDHPREEALDAGWRPATRPAARSSQPNYFDAMWPSEAKSAPASHPAESDYKPFDSQRFEAPKPLFDPKPYEPKSFESKSEAPKAEELDFEPPKFAPSTFDEPHHEEPAAEPEAALPAAEPVAILKSGVVDGMAYTLYVDGSIEAELPQGTLRFASINELRAHLEKSA